MSLTHEAIAAWPVTGNADKALARALATRRLPYALAASESAADLVATDPASGVVPLYLVQDGTLYEYDSLDSTTTASATCLVTSDGKRYKSGGITPPYSVLTVGTTAQPTTPSVGDTYLVPTAATGTDWAGKDGKVAIYTAAGWQFAIVPIGRGLYAEDTNVRYYRKADGTWASGFGAVALGAGSINITNMLGAKASFSVKVENQTTTTAPASPIAFVAYIVAGAGGAWSGYSVGDVAMCLSDGTWTRIVPDVGDRVYDKNLNLNVEWNGTAWTSSVGVFVNRKRVSSTSGTVNEIGSDQYPYSAATPPANTHYGKQDDALITSYTAKKTGALLHFKYRADVAAWSIVASGFAGAAADYEVVGALFRDSETNAIDYHKIGLRTGSATLLPMSIELDFEISTGDALSHNYVIVIVAGSTQGSPYFSRVSPSTMYRRSLEILEIG